MIGKILTLCCVLITGLMAFAPPGQSEDVKITTTKLTGQIFMLTGQGGNIGLFINTLHWLNDNTEFMNVGQPIDSAVLAIPDESTVKTVQAITIGAWPALAMLCGVVAWWVRRR